MAFCSYRCAVVQSVDTSVCILLWYFLYNAISHCRTDFNSFWKRTLAFMCGMVSRAVLVNHTRKNLPDVGMVKDKRISVNGKTSKTPTNMCKKGVRHANQDGSAFLIVLQTIVINELNPTRSAPVAQHSAVVVASPIREQIAVTFACPPAKVRACVKPLVRCRPVVVRSHLIHGPQLTR